jgi:hypothetical protein
MLSFDEGEPVPVLTVQGNCVRVTVPNTLQAGICNVRVMVNVTFPSSPTAHPCFASNPVPFQLIPVIQKPTPAPVPPAPLYSAAQGGTLTINVSPPVGNQQTVVVYIGNQAILQPQGPLGPPSTSTTVTVTVPATIAVGTYALRVEVDGAQSQLTQDTVQASPTYGQWLPQVGVTA